MKVHQFDRAFVDNSVQLFPDEVASNYWILYQGTSNFAEQEIESEGFRWKSTEFTRQDAEAMEGVFRGKA